MKKLMVISAVVAALGLAAGQAFARPAQTAAGTKVTVVMHDPGCHWLSAGGALETKLVAKGPVQLLNLDEATLKVAGHAGLRHVAVGKTLRLASGSYAITMVGQAADDNHLHLVVR